MNPSQDTLVVFWMAIPKPNPDDPWIKYMKVANYDVNDYALPIRRLVACKHCPKTPGLRIVNNSPGGGRQDWGLRLPTI